MTVGDAVASFLTVPYEASGGMCLMNEQDITDVLQERKTNESGTGITRPQQYRMTNLQYYHSASLGRWGIYLSSYAMSFIFSRIEYPR
jgi:hypothetical protein